MAVTADREALLKELGRWYGEQRFAIAWTNTNRPDRGDPKKVTTEGWQHTRPLANGDVGEDVFGRGLVCNPAIVLRPSGLIGVECDGEHDLARIESFGLPATLTEQSSLPTKQHRYFRPPVFDWGGGTLDLTLCRLSGDTLSQVANLGNQNIGGDRFDARLRNLVVKRHLETYGIDSADVVPGADRTLIQRCEQSKIDLSDQASSTVFVRNYLRSEGPEQTLSVRVTRDELESLTRDLVDEGIGAVHQLLDHIGRPPEAIELCLATGGMVQMPRIRERLDELFGIARVPRVPHGDRIISEGAAWIARDQTRLSLAKPLELLHADDSYITVIPAGTKLPLENEVTSRSIGMYCVDPRDGYAKFHFSRPEWPNRTQQYDNRVPYGTLLVGVDATAKPLRERLEVDVSIDHDLVAHIEARSSLLEDTEEVEVHDLEFGLKVGDRSNA
jgi:molecular chaperone DnaK